jgi:hypothetical protein
MGTQFEQVTSVTSSGQRIWGGESVLITRTVNEHSDLPQAFEAMHVTVWRPRPTTVPGGGVQVTEVPAGITTGGG